MKVLTVEFDNFIVLTTLATLGKNVTGKSNGKGNRKKGNGQKVTGPIIYEVQNSKYCI